MSWHINIPPAISPRKQVKCKLHIAAIEEIYGYCCVYPINGYKEITIYWYMYGWQLIPAVIIVYTNMHGDTYPVMSWHINMPSDKPQKTGKM